MYLRNILGFYCNMDTSRIFRVGDTSRIIRVGTCIYVIRIAAVSQEHVPACITRKKHGPKMTWFECWQEIDLVVVWVVELDCCIIGTCTRTYNMQKTRAENDMVWVLTRNWLGCCVGGRTRLDFRMGDRNWLDFSAAIGIHLILCGGGKKLGLVWIEMTWFLCGGHRNWIILRGRIKLT